MTQYLIVGMIVAAAVLYSAWTLMPSAWRRAGAARLAARAANSGMDARTATAIQLRLERAGGCSDCASCKGCAKGTTPPRN
jgi:alkylhydroperoxidase family enzyme